LHPFRLILDTIFSQTGDPKTVTPHRHTQVLAFFTAPAQ
jgi:hypothetical protein